MSDEHPRFAEFYKLYPRHVSRRTASRAFDAAIKRGATPDEIMVGLARYQFSPDPQFRPHPATWLNGERWLDETEESVPALDPRKLTGFAAIAYRDWMEEQKQQQQKQFALALPHG